MIAEVIEIDKECPELTDNEGETIKHIKTSIINAIVPFKKCLSEHNKKSKLNENKLTQIFVHRVEYQIRLLCENISVNSQYYDIFFNTKGVPDFYFYKCEETREHAALFVVEAKRLPPPSNKIRKKEYIIGGKNNGGIERYKLEKHGKGLCESGMLGFVEKQTFQYWYKTINSWIENLAKNDEVWKNDEILDMVTCNADYCKLNSIAHRSSGDADIKLHHWWVIF